MEPMVERFVRYTSINTRSNEESTTIPSTQTQVDFATNVLVPDLKAIGLDEVIYNRENGFVIGTLNANTQMQRPLPLVLSPIWIRPTITQKILSHASLKTMMATIFASTKNIRFSHVAKIFLI